MSAEALVDAAEVVIMAYKGDPYTMEISWRTAMPDYQELSELVKWR